MSDCANRIMGYKGEGLGIRRPERQRHGSGHVDLIKSIRAGKPLNEGMRIAESTLTAIGGRLAATTGRSFTWDWLLKASKATRPDRSMWKPGPGLFHPISTGCDPLV